MFQSPNVDELLARITSTRLTEWYAYLELLDEEARTEAVAQLELDNARMGVLAATVANFSGRGKKWFKPGDFTGQEPKVETVENQALAFFGARPGVKRQKKQKAR